MNASLTYWLKARYRANQPEIAKLAQDDSPAVNLRNAFRRLARRWTRRFDDLAGDLAKYFAQETAKRSTAALQSMLRKGGMSVRFKMTRAMNDVMQATLTQQVSLIKSIPAQYLTQIEGSVMRSVAAGRDLGTLAEELQHHYGVTRRRAAFIARSQNNLATASMTRVRQQEAGITEAIWVHSGGGKEPRPTHLKAGKDRVHFRVDEGWWDPAEQAFVWPGQLPNCRCVSRPVVIGFS